MFKLTQKRIDLILVGSLITISIIATVYGILQPIPFWDWAWGRHQNILSWYIRPLFIPLLVYFAYRRSLSGIIVSLVAVLTSMYWFPTPINPNDMVVGFLEEEQSYLLKDWTVAKVLVSTLVPVSLGALIYAFWQKSIKAGFVVINLIAIVKVLWSVIYDQESGWAVIPFAVIGLIITNLVVYVAIRKFKSN